MQELINRAKELLADGTVARVLGWKAGGGFQTGRQDACMLKTM